MTPKLVSILKKHADLELRENTVTTAGQFAISNFKSKAALIDVSLQHFVNTRYYTKYSLELFLEAAAKLIHFLFRRPLSP